MALVLDHDVCILMGFLFGLFAFLTVMMYLGILYQKMSDIKTEVMMLRGMTNMQPSKPTQTFDRRKVRPEGAR